MRSRANGRGRLGHALGIGAVLVLGGWTGCKGPHADVPTEAFVQQVLLPPEAPAAAESLVAEPIAPKNAASAAESLPMPRPVEDEKPAGITGPPAELLTLARALALTAEANPRLRYMRARIDQARAGADITFSEFLPVATVRNRYFAGGPALFALPTAAPFGGVVQFTSPTHEHEMTELHLQWLVFDFGRRTGRYRQANLAADIAALQYERAVQTAHFNVTAAYFEQLRALAVRRIAVEAVRRAEADLVDARNLLRKGVLIRNDVLRAEVLLSNARLELIAAERAVGTARARLNEAIGINAGCATAVTDLREEPAFALPLADALGLAVENRREFAAALDGVRSAQAGRDVAHADFLPKISVHGAGNYLAPPDEQHTLYDGGVFVEMGLFEGGRRVGRLHQADAEVRAAVAQGQEVCNRIALEVNTAWLEVAEARQRVELARTTLAQATENLRVVRRLFRGGDARPVDLVDAELIYVRAEQDNASALYDYQTTLARLAYAVGISLEQLVSLAAPPCPGPRDEH